MKLGEIVDVLKRYEKRYRFLDVFADDVDDLNEVPWETSEPGIFRYEADRTLYCQPFDKGVLRFSLEAKSPWGKIAVLGAVGAAVGAASETKGGTLGGLVLGMLVGAAIGDRVEMNRIMALQHDGAEWKLYDGPLLPWAKKSLLPQT